MTRPSGIDAIAEAAAHKFLRRRSMRFLECAIDLLVTESNPEDVADILEQHAQNLRDWR